MQPATPITTYDDVLAFAATLDATTAGGATRYARNLLSANEDWVMLQAYRQTCIDQHISHGRISWMQKMARMAIDARHIQWYPHKQ